MVNWQNGIKPNLNVETKTIIDTKQAEDSQNNEKVKIVAKSTISAPKGATRKLKSFLKHLLPNSFTSCINKISTFIIKFFSFPNAVKFSSNSKVHIDSDDQFNIKTNLEERSLKGKKDVYTREDASLGVREKTRLHYESESKAQPNYKKMGIAVEFSDLKNLDANNISFDQAHYAAKNFLKSNKPEGKRLDNECEYVANQLLTILDQQGDEKFTGERINSLNDLKQALVSKYKENNKTEESLDYELFKDIYREKHGQGSAKDIDRGPEFEALRNACEDKFELDLYEKFQSAQNADEKYEALFAMFEDSALEVIDRSRFNVDKNSKVTVIEGFSTKNSIQIREALLSKNNPDIKPHQKLQNLLLACANKQATAKSSIINSLVKAMPKEIQDNPDEILKFISNNIASSIPQLKKTAWEDGAEKTVSFKNVNDDDILVMDTIIDKLFDNEDAKNILRTFIKENENETNFNILDSTKDNKIDFDDLPFEDVLESKEVVDDQTLLKEQMEKARYNLKGNP